MTTQLNNEYTISRSRPLNISRTRPAFEKLLIGPIMIFGEMITGGHYLEVLRLGKQMVVGKNNSPSYWMLHKTFVSQSGSFCGAFYRGFLPWGLLQCIEGGPLLFVQHESKCHLVDSRGWTPGAAEKASGFLGGAAQAVVMNPFQKLMVTVVASNKMNALPPLQACQKVIGEFGVVSLFDGLIPHVMRRSLDWGIRFSVSSEAKNYFMEHSRRGQTEEMRLHEMMGFGLIGGAVSALTHPIDNVITNAQKPLPRGSSRSVLAVIRRMYFESGMKAFTRGWGVRVIDNAWHTAWVYGVGTVAYDYVRRGIATIDPENYEK